MEQWQIDGWSTPPGARRGRKALYPWDTWADGNYHVIESGVDFQVDPNNMRVQMANVARRRGMRAAASIQRNRFSGRIGLLIRFLSPGNEEFHEADGLIRAYISRDPFTTDVDGCLPSVHYALASLTSEEYASYPEGLLSQSEREMLGESVSQA